MRNFIGIIAVAAAGLGFSAPAWADHGSEHAPTEAHEDGIVQDDEDDEDDALEDILNDDDLESVKDEQDALRSGDIDDRVGVADETIIEEDAAGEMGLCRVAVVMTRGPKVLRSSSPEAGTTLGSVQLLFRSSRRILRAGSSSSSSAKALAARTAGSSWLRLRTARRLLAEHNHPDSLKAPPSPPGGGAASSSEEEQEAWQEGQGVFS